jgi:hypothetical protein
MTRPYSKSELEDLEKEIYIRHRLGNTLAVHVPCLHEYRVKKGGRKEQNILQNSIDERFIMTDQTCSICFKIRTSTQEMPELPSESEPLSKNKIEKIDFFYKWLYRHDL